MALALVCFTLSTSMGSLHASDAILLMISTISCFETTILSPQSLRILTYLGSENGLDGKTGSPEKMSRSSGSGEYSMFGGLGFPTDTGTNGS